MYLPVLFPRRFTLAGLMGIRCKQVTKPYLQNKDQFVLFRSIANIFPRVQQFCDENVCEVMNDVDIIDSLQQIRNLINVHKLTESLLKGGIIMIFTFIQI